MKTTIKLILFAYVFFFWQQAVWSLDEKGKSEPATKGLSDNYPYSYILGSWGMLIGFSVAPCCAGRREADDQKIPILCMLYSTTLGATGFMIGYLIDNSPSRALIFSIYGALIGVVISQCTINTESDRTEFSDRELFKSCLIIPVLLGLSGYLLAIFQDFFEPQVE